MSTRAVEGPSGTVSKLPPLHRLPSTPSVGVGNEVYGGCKPFREGLTPDETTDEDRLGNECYDEWLMKVTHRAMCNEGKNTAIFLAVGGGVLEMEALRRMRDWLLDFEAIEHIVLIDPFTSHKYAEEIKKKFKEEFPTKTVEYFVGASQSETAYSKATEYFCSENKTIRFVAGINFGRMIAPTPEHIAILDDTITFYTLLEQKVEQDAFRTKIIGYRSDKHVVEERKFEDIITSETNLRNAMCRLVRS